MTYCLAMRLDEGLVFMSDTRTNAGVDNIGTYRKLHVLTPAADRVFVLQSAGNLATTQEVLDRIQVDIDTPGDHESLLSVNRMFEAALYVGRLSHEVNQRHWAALNAVGADGTATFILGGQIAGLAPDILLVYPEGNYIRASDDRPFLQIGESKFGKFLLEMAVEAGAGLVTASKIAIGSMMSTARANLAVGPPYDLAIYPTNALTIEEFRILPDSTVLARLQAIWQRHMLQVVQDMPSVHDLDELDRRIEQDRGSL
jgi:putative proteasome-type protease